ncbi:uncharacterized protein LOC124456571 isoform X1 [Xenia sp. Carnegie-2017]|uniref:uncharacterized protein LOC124456571 isoform X1 n=1 Tax=Xenia sp. Carnegie-2017 TaxID=2897299 RepID=UPI001F03E87F|nr:uncharacterized protein LOC124456571 isoform X1 [Xenia sp. Carnegie-2017]
MKVERITMAVVALHNFLIKSEAKQPACSRHYLPHGFVDSEDRNGKILLGSWRASVENAQGLKSIGRQGSNFYKKDASEVRDQFKEYFIKPEGEVPWQQNHISFNGNLE